MAADGCDSDPLVEVTFFDHDTLLLCGDEDGMQEGKLLCPDVDGGGDGRLRQRGNPLL